MSHGHQGKATKHHEHNHATKANVRTFFDEKDTHNATHLVWCPVTRRAAVVDSVMDFDFTSGSLFHNQADAVLAFVKQHQLHVDYILETRIHDDHLSAAQYLKKKLDCHSKICIGEHVNQAQEIFKLKFNLGEDYCSSTDFDRVFKDGDTVDLGNLKVKVLHTPGRSVESVTYYIEDDVAFVGDALVMPDQGSARCDFPGANAADMFQSMQKLLHLPSSVHVFVGHDLKEQSRDYKWQTSISDQKSHNTFLRQHGTVEKFVDARKKKDESLTLPRVFYPAVQVNIRAGKLPDPEENGVSFVKIPITAL